MDNDNVLQRLCREYLLRLRYLAQKHGLLPQLQYLLVSNRNKTCVATMHEVEMLSRLCNDERLHYKDVPKVLNKSYRECYEADDFSKIKKLPNQGIYSKVGTLLYKDKLEKKDGIQQG